MISGIADHGAVKDPWKHRSAGMSCKTCMFGVFGRSDPDSATGSLGRCRRHAPTMGGYPAIYESDWCGDHKLEKS